MAIVAKLPPEAVLRCTTKLVSLLAVSVQLKLILLDDPAIAVKPVGAFGVVTEAGDVSRCQVWFMGLIFFLERVSFSLTLVFLFS